MVQDDAVAWDALELGRRSRCRGLFVYVCFPPLYSLRSSFARRTCRLDVEFCIAIMMALRALLATATIFVGLANGLADTDTITWGGDNSRAGYQT